MPASEVVWTVDALSRDLAAGRTTSRALVEEALARIADPSGEGARAVLKTYAETARAEADHADRLRKVGIVRSAVDALPITVKDLFDVTGQVSRAGSIVLNDAPPAGRDAAAVADAGPFALTDPGAGRRVAFQDVQIGASRSDNRRHRADRLLADLLDTRHLLHAPAGAADGTEVGDVLAVRGHQRFVVHGQ